MSCQVSRIRILLSLIYDLKRKRAYREMEEEVRIALDRYPSKPKLQVLLVERHVGDWEDAGRPRTC